MSQDFKSTQEIDPVGTARFAQFLLGTAFLIVLIALSLAVWAFFKS